MEESNNQMSGITAREILDAAINLNEGQKIITKCDSFQEMESLRTNLYKARRALLKAHKTLAYSLYITRERVDNNYLVTVTKEKTVSNVVIIDVDGTVKPFERTEVAITGSETEKERMSRFMREAGHTEEEIAAAVAEDTTAEKGEDDFDKAASRMEALQDEEETEEIKTKTKTLKEGGKK